LSKKSLTGFSTILNARNVKERMAMGNNGVQQKTTGFNGKQREKTQPTNASNPKTKKQSETQ